MSNVLIEVKGLSKCFDKTPAVNNIGFSVKKGEIFGFLGPNGAGKTTTINMLTGLTRPDSGQIHINQLDGIKDIKKAQEIIGIVPDESNLYAEMNGFDNLVFCAALYGINKSVREKRAIDLLKEFGLTGIENKTFKQYSKGMKRKLTIAAGIIHKPDILFLDEPTTGIDVESARHIRELILEMNKSGTTIFLTTHYIEEAERLCDRICFIVKGQIVKIASINELMNDNQKENIMQFKVNDDLKEVKAELTDRFRKYRPVFLSNKVFNVHSSESIGLFQFVKFIEDKNITVLEAKLIRPSLEEVFVKVTGIGVEKMKKDKEGRKV